MQYKSFDQKTVNRNTYLSKKKNRCFDRHQLDKINKKIIKNGTTARN